MSGLDESLLAERRSVVEEFEKQVTDITEQIEDDIQKVKESEEKITVTDILVQSSQKWDTSRTWTYLPSRKLLCNTRSSTSSS